ncbi:MAG TPA: PEP-CTERM sorting domain-containing protein [Terriglobales bacterium]|nr:PEP-CTERM sorting domain-containing protein [Terriglobales bacterium]
MSGTLQTGAVGVLGGIFNVTSINPDLMLALFGSIPPGPSTGSIGQVLFNMQYNGSSYSGTIGSTNLIASIPEPAGLLLLGSGLILGAGFLRRNLEGVRSEKSESLLS